ncbi:MULTISPECIES: phage tail assembly chaperone [unclassified Pseudomonas]|uniref:phage tail assembly chaperone n=1 Tax=unclassified Pseudomonas TaxID=196821 RepID=UPI002248D25A|nr:hypothetical protein [Pseudomonas sp. DCB_BG]MCX2708363.1 hypothetical protein [Pseudomonas sp. DCB_BG]
MIKQQIINVDGTDYLFNSLPTTRGMGVLRMLMSLAGPAVAALQSGAEDSVTKAILAVCSTIEQPLFEGLVAALMPTVNTATGAAINVDNHFAGQYMHLWNVVYAAIEFNFGDVMQAVGGMVGLTLTETPDGGEATAVE